MSRASSVNTTQPQAVDTATYNPFHKFEDYYHNKCTDYISFNILDRDLVIQNFNSK